MASQKILVPYNFTAYDEKALDFVIQTFAGNKDVEITLFNAYTPIPEVDMRESPIMEKLKNNLSLLSQKNKEQEDELRAVKQNLLQKGFSENQVRCEFQPRKKDIAAGIISLANNHNFNVVILNHKPGKLSHFFTGNVFSKVVNGLKDTAVCIIS